MGLFTTPVVGAPGPARGPLSADERLGLFASLAARLVMRGKSLLESGGSRGNKGLMAPQRLYGTSGWFMARQHETTPSGFATRF